MTAWPPPASVAALIFPARALALLVGERPASEQAVKRGTSNSPLCLSEGAEELADGWAHLKTDPVKQR